MRMIRIVTLTASLCLASCGGGSQSGPTGTSTSAEGLANAENPENTAQNTPPEPSSISPANPAAALPDEPVQLPSLPRSYRRSIGVLLWDLDEHVVAVVSGRRSHPEYEADREQSYTAHIRGHGAWNMERLPEACQLLADGSEDKTLECTLSYAASATEAMETLFIVATPGEEVLVELVYTDLHPQEPHHGVSSERSIFVSNEPESVPDSFRYQSTSLELLNPVENALYASVSGRQGEYVAELLPNDGYTAILDGDAEWQEELLPDSCQLVVTAENVTDNKALTCKTGFNSSTQSRFRHILPIKPLADTSIEVQITFDPTEWDEFFDGREVSASIDHQQSPQPAFELRDVWRSLPPVYLIPEQQTLQVSMDLIQSAPVSVTSRLEISVSDGYRIASLDEVEMDDGDAFFRIKWANSRGNIYDLPVIDRPVCSLDEDIVCNMSESVPYAVPRFAFGIESLSGNDGTLTISVFTEQDGIEDTTPVLQRQIDLKQVLPMRIIQEIAQSARTDSITELPPGIFGGELSFDSLPSGITLMGASGDEPTVLIGGTTRPLIQFMSAGSTLSNLVLRTYGEQLIGSVGANMTIEHSVIEPADLSQPYLLNGLLPRWHANAIRLTKNTIRNFGRANSDDKNTLLFISRGETFLQQNTFHNNDSESLIHVPSSSYLVVENNNFINNSSFLEIDSLPWRLNIQNNMFIDTPPAIQYSNATNISGDERTLAEQTRLAVNQNIPSSVSPENVKPHRYWPYSGDTWLLIANNLVSNGEDTETTPLADQQLSAMPGVNDLNNTVSGDPLLVNVAAGNYKLQPGSIAIDNAALPTEYEWFKPENQSCFRGICSWYLRASNSNSPSELLSQPDASEQIQPIDGNGDGIVEYDIGANEFDPAKP